MDICLHFSKGKYLEVELLVIAFKFLINWQVISQSGWYHFTSLPALYERPRLSTASRNHGFFLIINFWLHWVFVAAHGLSLVVVSGALLSVGCQLIVVASLVAEQRLSCAGSVVEAQ